MSIYLKHFGLTREPFSIVPDPGFLYPSNHHRQAVAHLKYGLDREGGFILLTGEVGTGKTTLTRTMLKRLPAHVRVAYVLNSKLKVSDALASICDELSIELPSSRGRSFSKVCIDGLNQDLLQAHAEGKKTLIVIEEAQNLTPEVLETLRLLSNLETHTHKLLHILLVGQPELLEILAQKELRQLNQRVVSRFHLLPLEKDDLSNYVNHRLHRAGANRPIFDRACMSSLYRLTGGVPRLINLVCQHSLLAAYSIEAKSVTPKLVKQAAVEILGRENTGLQWSKKWLYAAAPGIIIILAALIYALQPPAPDPLIAEPAEAAVAEIISPPSNPFVALFDIWSVQASELYSQEEFFDLAESHGLRAERLDSGDIADLQKVNRPGIVRLKDESGFLKSYLITEITQISVVVRKGADSQLLGLQDFIARWSGSFVYLWRPPQQIGSLKLGDSNPLALDWLQSRLAAVDTNAEIIISGGRYTQAVADQVLAFQQQQNIKADGVVGRETLLRLNQLTDNSIPRLRGLD